jgi:hypothetical protein
MRCVCCDKNLNDYESTRKHAFTGEYLDTCNACLSEINDMVNIPTITREDLANCGDIVEHVDSPEIDVYNSLYREDINE